MILDTNTISALADGDEKLLSVLMGSHRHQIPVIVLGEYRYGLLRSRERGLREQWLNELQNYSDVLEVNAETSIYYAQVREELRVLGNPIPENDVWIAALAIQHNLEVVSRDLHFDHVRGLRRISW